MGRGQRGRLQSRRFAAAEALGRGRSVGVRSKDGIRLHAEVFGPEDGYPVVLAHGITCAIRVWAYQIADLAKDHRVIAFDHRGHGRSAVPARRSGYSLDCLAGDIDAVLEATLKPGERAVVAGHSMGGIAISSWAERYPDRVPQLADAVALINTTTGDLIRHVQFLPVPPQLAAARVRAGGHAAEDVRRGASAASGRPAEPAVRLDDRGGPRRRPRDRRVRLPTVQRDTARGPRRLGPRARRLAGNASAHRVEEPDRADDGDRQREGPSAADGVIAPDRQRGAESGAVRRTVRRPLRDPGTPRRGQQAPALADRVGARGPPRLAS